MPRLRRSNSADPGLTHRRRGRGFEYLDQHGAALRDQETLLRIHELAIPPAWKDVWICPDPRGHLQATGIDAAGRKQYLYHERWRAHRDRLKFESMLDFGASLRALRRRVARDLRFSGSEPLPRERVLACALRLLDLGFFRIGSEDYAEQNESYGLTTMLRSHVALQDGELVFDFIAKSGRKRVQAIADPEALAVVAELKRRRAGTRLLAYRDGRRWAEVDAEEVNAYIKRYAGEEFSAKDFRTWNATVLAAVALAGSGEPPASRTARDRRVAAAIKTVSDYLGNTPAVARASYVDPRVLDRYREGVTIAPALGADLADMRARTRIETATLELLREAHSQRRAA